jgi:seryl-tRNA synthetase
MLDLRAIREDPEPARAALARRDAAAELDEVLRLDERRRELLPEIEAGRARQNEANDAIAQAKRSGGDAEAAIAEMRELSSKIKEGEAELREVEEKRDEAAARLPNLPDPEAPDGLSEDDAVTLREVGERPAFDFEISDHLEIGADLGLIEIEAAARASGARFAYLLGDLVMIELALVRYALDLLAEEGHKAVAPPVLVREEALFGTGFLPGDRAQIYEIPEDDLYLAGTSPRCTATRSSSPVRCRSVTRAFRPAFAARPGRPGRTRAGSSACISSTRSRCSRSLSPRSRRPSTSGCSRSRSAC